MISVRSLCDLRNDDERCQPTEPVAIAVCSIIRDHTHAKNVHYIGPTFGQSSPSYWMASVILYCVGATLHGRSAPGDNIKCVCVCVCAHRLHDSMSMVVRMMMRRWAPVCMPPVMFIPAVDADRPSATPRHAASVRHIN